MLDHTIGVISGWNGTFISACRDVASSSKKTSIEGIYDTCKTKYLDGYQQLMKMRRQTICIHTPSRMWDEITFPFRHVNGYTEFISNFISHSIMDVFIHPSILESKSNHVKGVYDCHVWFTGAVSITHTVFSAISKDSYSSRVNSCVWPPDVLLMNK